MSAREIADRRQRAREAYYGTAGWAADPDDALTEATEVATQVKITREMVQILANGGASDVQDLRDIFAVAGFEVIE